MTHVMTDVVDVKLASVCFIAMQIMPIQMILMHTAVPALLSWGTSTSHTPTRSKAMQITRKSMMSGITRTLNLPVTLKQMADWKYGGVLIQTAMPHLSMADREFIITGVTDEEWQEEFAEEQSDD